MTTACRRAPRDKKTRENKQQTDPRGEDKKEKQNKINYEWIYEMHTFWFETQTFLE